MNVLFSPPAKPLLSASLLRKFAAGSYRIAGLLSAREAVSETVATRVHLNLSPNQAWNHIMLYEEVPGRPSLLLRILLPQPLRTEGDKTRVGSAVRCVYRGGDLVKRITEVVRPSSLRFEVIGQSLGIEDCIRTRGGSYQILSCRDATDVVLITNYDAYLHPRRVWRPLEVLLVRQLHAHILRGMYAAVMPRNQAIRPESLARPCNCLGVPTCTVSQSFSRR